MKLKILSVLIATSLSTPFLVSAETLVGTLHFEAQNCAVGYYCQYEADTAGVEGINSEKLYEYTMTVQGTPELPAGVSSINTTLWTNGSTKAVTGANAPQSVSTWEGFDAEVKFEGGTDGGDGGTDGGNGVIPDANATIYHVTFPYTEDQTTIDVFNTETVYSDTIIMSNLIAGVMYTHLIEQKYTGLQYNKDYLIGTLLGQLLQESGLTDSIINPNFDANAIRQAIHTDEFKETLLAGGQGGPYQINDYAKRLPSPDEPGALGLVNYDALRKELGYSIENQDNNSQTSERGPDGLEDVYFGPMSAAFYHFNDINRMQVNASHDYYVYYEQWNTCFNETLKDTQLDDNELRLADFIMNVVYNAGDYSSVLGTYLDMCVTRDSGKLAEMNNYNLDPFDYQEAIGGSGGEGTSTYYRYPRQVSFYNDQLNNINLSASGLNMENHIAFTAEEFKGVFTKAMVQLSYKIDDTEESDLTNFTQQEVETAFNQAVSNAGATTTTEFMLDNEESIASLYNLLGDAITELETTKQIQFSAVTGATEIPTPPVDGEEWDKDKTYSDKCTYVTYNSDTYINAWYTQGDTPNYGEAQQMKDNGYMGSSPWMFGDDEVNKTNSGCE